MYIQKIAMNILLSIIQYKLSAFKTTYKIACNTRSSHLSQLMVTQPCPAGYQLRRIE